MLLIGLVGLQVSIPVGEPEWLVPSWAPLRLTDYDRSPIGPGWPILHALAWAVLIAVVATALWRRVASAARLRVDKGRCSPLGNVTIHTTGVLGTRALVPAQHPATPDGSPIKPSRSVTHHAESD